MPGTDQATWERILRLARAGERVVIVDGSEEPIVLMPLRTLEEGGRGVRGKAEGDKRTVDKQPRAPSFDPVAWEKELVAGPEDELEAEERFYLEPVE